MATIRKRGKRYQVQVRRRGQAPISKSFLQLEDARQWARQMEVKADRRELPPDPKALNRMTLKELVERYRDEVSPRKRTGETENIVLNAFLRDNQRLCAKTLSSLSIRDFLAYRDDRLRDIQLSTLRRDLNRLHHMFEVARKEWDLALKNPLSGIELNGREVRRERRLRQGELDKLLKAAGNCQDGTVARIIVFALETAMRRGEILAMRFRDIDWAEPSLLIPYTKNGDARTIPLTERALSVITPSTRDRVFPLTANAFRLSWQRVSDRAEIDDLHFHDLRHEAIGRPFEKGLSVPEVALISGHKDMRMLFRYTHPIRQQVRRKLVEAQAR